MLRRLSASNDEFKPIDFSDGLNIIVAERDPEASETDSRNARGKTSLLQAINYCLGSNRPAAFQALADDDWAFTLELDLFGDRVEATRQLRGGGRVAVQGRTGSAEAVLSEYQREDGTVSLADWKFLLGLALFGLDEQFESGEQSISVRTLLSYVIRLEAPRDPTKILSQQPAWSSRQHIAFLLGLDWRYTQELTRMQKDQDAFKALAYATEVDLVPGLVESEPDLLIRRGELERELTAAQQQADAFVVLEDPDGTLAESDQVAKELIGLNDEQMVDTRLLTLYRESMDETSEEPNDAVVGEVYRELGLAFSSAALRRFGEVEAFHRTLVGNRRRFIESETVRLQGAIREREPRVQQLQRRRKELVRQLASGGGLDDLLELQRRVSDAAARLESIDEAIQKVRSVSVAQETLNVRKATTRRDARDALERDREFVDAVNSRFSGVIRTLYGRSASLTVEIDESGYKFSIKVSGSSSSGITKMQLFAFDQTLMELSRHGRHPHFLIHDSAVFDGVDPRQVAGALNLARDIVSASGSQYIVTLNTNDIPDAISSADWYPAAVKRTILDTEKGGAFGVVF
jgi:uncharacterized protein YydD (DUF2326 family)